MSGEATIKGELRTWANLDSRDDVGLETTAEVTLNGEVILREEKVLSIRIEWERPPTSPANLLLLSINQPLPRLCESLYRLVDLNKAVAPYVTARFGNCHAEPIILEQGEGAVFYFPPFNGKMDEAYRYTTQAGLKKISVTSEMRAKGK